MCNDEIDLISFIREDQRERLHTLCVAIREAGGRILIVGGAVRDSLLQDQPNDLDLEVFGLEEAAAENLLQRVVPLEKVGRSFPVWKVKGTSIDIALPRVEEKMGRGHTDFKWRTSPEMTMEVAARRRDYTINAMGWDPLTRELLDPYGGQSDLREKRLRPVSDQFEEDPLRVLRGMQFVARFGMEADTETLERCRKLSPAALAPERFFDEWQKLLLLGKKPSQGLFFLEAAGWLRFYPELEALVNCPQDPRWHPEGSVWRHTLYALDAFAQDRIGDPIEDMVVGLAVLCHDMGKAVTTVREGEAIRSPGHESAGIEITRQFMGRITRDPSWVKEVEPLVATHMRPRQLYEQKSGASAVRRLANKVGRLDRLLRVCKADAGGRPPLPVGSFPEGNWLRCEAAQLKVGDRRPQAILQGRDLLELGVAPGPGMGALLNELFEMQLDGEFEFREKGMKIAALKLRAASQDRT